MGELLGITGAIGSGKSTAARFFADMEPNHSQYETWHIVAQVATAFNQALKAELAYETTNNPVDLANQVLIWLPDAISEHLHHDVVWNQLAFSKHDSHARPDLFEKLFTYLKMVGKNPTLLDTPLTDETKETFRPLLQWLGNYLVVKVSKTIWYDELIRHIQLRDTQTNLIIVGGVRYPSDAEVLRVNGGRIVAIERPGTSSSTDATETQRSEINPDIIVHNNGTLDELRQTIETVWNDIAAGRPQKAYTASTSGNTL